MTLLIALLALTLPPADSPQPVPQEAWQLTLPDAIRIGLDNSEVVRVITAGAQAAPVGGFEPEAVPARDPRITIARLNADASIWTFKDSIMAHVRSVEQQYWALAQQRATLQGRETAVRLIDEIRQQAQVDLKAERIKPEALAEAEQALQNARLNLVTATSDLITVERQLRNILGLPAADNRRIVPATAATEAKQTPDWDQSLQQMVAESPSIAQQREILAAACLREAIGGAPTDDPARLHSQSERQQSTLRQVVGEAKHTLARFFLEVDANFKQFETARRLAGSARERLEDQRAAYDRREIPIDRLLDAVSQSANATSQEAEFKYSYNTTIAAFEEARGTLLAVDKITVIPGPASAATPTPVAPPAPTAPKAAQAETFKVHALVGGYRLIDVEVQRVISPAAIAPK